MFEYQALDYHKGEFRLLHLAPGRADDPIRGNLVHAFLDTQPIYHALSYSCGSLTEPQNILLAGEDFRIPNNLYEALKALRNTNSELVIWIDAICINQQDLDARSEEIKRMRPIYENAALVKVWLGPATKDSSLAMSIVREMSREGMWSAEQVFEVLRASNGARSLRALVELFRREYWQRTWVVQEFYLAKKATIHCGPDSVTQAELKAVSGYTLQWHGQFSVAFEDDMERGIKAITGQNFLPQDFADVFPEISPQELSPISLLKSGGPIAMRPAKLKSLYGPNPARPELLDCLI
jgi:hypothetical protein